MKLKDQVCIITGGGSGIGRDAALKIAREGATVVIVGRTESKLESTISEIKTMGGTAEYYTLDVSDFNAVQKMVDDVYEKYGRIDVLVNNAGHSSHNRRLLNTTPEETRSVVDSNLIGTFFCTQAVVPTMLKAKSGTIINISSLAAVTPGPFSGFAYGAAKAGVINFTEFLNNDLRNTGIRASVIIPGEVATPILDKRPIPPDTDARAMMVDVAETSAAILLVATLPPRSNIPELVIRPTMHRDMTGEVVELDG
ncbi:SDR family oxidoreductase [Candidatus Poribacteria bacterium]|nr:SDR family oxidoreductase [Candidatus Poribacteria bacterium]MYF54168.1 SDR family oxidoreductase [Candidatus Poribacteria bacterium]MYI94144.1 SDR family oxidoreductase [Candidatus Poribacteria bacterium]